MRFGRIRGRRGRQLVRSHAGVVGRPEPSVPGQSVPARAVTPAPGRECMRRGDNACAQATTSAPVRRRVLRGRGVFSQTPQTSVLGRRCLRPGDNIRMHAGDNVCARATTGAAWEGCFFTNTPNFSTQATTSASERQRVRPGDDVYTRATTFGSWFRNVHIFSCFGNPNKTFPLSLENYWNCVEDSNPKLFLVCRNTKTQENTK